MAGAEAQAWGLYDVLPLGKQVGTRSIPAEMRRSVVVRGCFTPADAEAISQIAEAWGVRPSVALWAMVRSLLDRARLRHQPELGEIGLAIAAGIEVLYDRDTDQALSGPAGMESRGSSVPFGRVDADGLSDGAGEDRPEG